MARRLPSQPPQLPGFSHMRVLGTGGFADVFLYEQNMPRRHVAVKVLLSDLVDEQLRQMFQAEANLMAQLSAHPSILTVHQAGIASDGRPYLVMELCAPTIAERYRESPLTVPEALRIAVRIGSAVETAHRAGVLHRDIKPSNILRTAYGHPVLADFGIASTLGAAEGEGAAGLSIPWSAPEVLLDETPGTVASEVWSLAATVYSLLAGRSPFEVPDGANGSSELIERIVRAKPRPIARADVPGSLEVLLGRAMSRKAEQRPASALELVQGFRAIEAELELPQTPVEIAVEEWAVGTVAQDEDRTQLQPAVRDRGAAPARVGRRRRAAEPARDYIARSPRAERSGDGQTGQTSPGMRRLAWILTAAAALVTVFGIVTIAVLLRVLGEGIPVVDAVEVQHADGASVVFTWSDPGIEKGDRYEITVTDGSLASPPTLQLAPRFVVDSDPGNTVCLSVVVNRNGMPGEASAEKCVEVPGP